MSSHNISSGSSGWLWAAILGVLAGGSLGWCTQYYLSDRDFRQMTTYAYVRGACGGQMETCSGTIAVVGADGKAVDKYRLTHGAVFVKGARGYQATRPVLFKDACEACLFTRDY